MKSRLVLNTNELVKKLQPVPGDELPGKMLRIITVSNHRWT